MTRAGDGNLRFSLSWPNLTYEERLKKLNLPSLEFRRARGDMIETYKIIHGVYDSTTTTSL